MVKIDPSEITPKSLYLSRRQFIGSAGATLVGALALAACKGNPTYRSPRVRTSLSPVRPPMSWGLH